MNDHHNKLKKDKSMTDINILVNGNRCKTYFHEGKAYIEGKPGSEYEIEVKNNVGNRVEAIATVDGLSVMTGKPGTTDEGGYVIDPYAAFRIKGFRYSDERCGAFRFSLKEQSYAKTKGDKSEINCGVIACKVYREKIVYPQISKVFRKRFTPRTIWDETWEWQDEPVYGTPSPCTSPVTGGLYGPGRYGYSTADGLEGRMPQSSTLRCCSDGTSGGIFQGQSNASTINYSAVAGEPVASNDVFNLGTEWGSDKVSKVVSTTFNRDTILTDFVLYYTDREGLLALGIPLNSPAKVHFPESFPGNYAQPPKGWNR